MADKVLIQQEIHSIAYLWYQALYYQTTGFLRHECNSKFKTSFLTTT